MDPKSLNYDAKAIRDDGSCISLAELFADDYEGPYTDSVKTTAGIFNSSTSNIGFNVSVVETNSNKLLISAPLNLPFTVDSNTVIFHNTPYSSTDFINGYLYLKVDTLFYYLSYTKNIDSPAYRVSRGYGVQLK